jgi:hypothetical protein
MRCPHDGGTCHHRCSVHRKDGTCTRKAHGESLTTPWPGFPVEQDTPVSDERAHGLAHMAQVPGEGNPFKVETQDLTRQMTPDPNAGLITDRFLHEVRVAQVGSCECVTMTPDPRYHRPWCRFRLLTQLLNAAEALYAKSIPALASQPAPAVPDYPKAEEPWSL